MSEIIDTCEVAKLIRQELKTHFPGVKFGVRSRKYSGGSSIDVGWQDGPAYEKVNTLIKKFAGSGFDGMQDLKYDLGNNYGVDFVFANRRISDEKHIAKCRELADRFGLEWTGDPGHMRVGNDWLTNKAWQELNQIDL